MLACMDIWIVIPASDPGGGDEEEPVTPAKESHGEPAPAEEEAAPANVGPGRYRSPYHRTSSNSILESCACVSMT